MAYEPTLLVVLYASTTIFLLCIKMCICTYESRKCLVMQHVPPLYPTMFQLCGGDVFMSDFKGLNIFSTFLFLCHLILMNNLTFFFFFIAWSSF